jgi:hypothetical protein
VFVRLHGYFDNLFEQMKMQVDGVVQLQTEMQDLRRQVEDLSDKLARLADTAKSQGP